MPKSKYRPNASDVQSGWYSDRMGTLDKSVKGGGDPIKSATEENSAARTPQATGGGPMGLSPAAIVKALQNDGQLQASTEASAPGQDLVYVQDPSAAKNPYVNQDVVQSGWFVKSDDPMAQQDGLIDVDVLMAEQQAKLQKAEGMVEEDEVEEAEEEDEDELEASHAPASEESTQADKYSRGDETTGFSSPEEAENWATQSLYRKDKVKKSYGLDEMEAWLQKSSARPEIPEETAASILEAFLGDDDELEKAGPFIGPRGGKWADAKHTIPWSEKEHGGGPKKKKSPIPENISEAAAMAQEVGINATAHPKTVMSGDPGFGKPQVIEQETVHDNSLLVDKKDIGKLRDAGAKVTDKGAVSVGDLKSAVKKLKDQAGDTSLKMSEAMAKVYLKKVGAKGVKAPPGKAAEPGTPIADLMNAGLIQKEGDKFKLTAEGKKMAGLDKPTTNKKAKGKGGMKHEPPPAKNYGSGPMDFTRFEHGSYHVEDHGAGVHALYFRGARKRKPEIIGNFSSREAAKQGIDHHTKTGWSKPGSIGPEINPEADWLKTEKSMKELEDYIQKGGEGSRGGKVIGRTKSGKPIYAQTMHPGHKNFSSQDHEEAAQHHMKQGNKEGHAAHSNFAAVKKPGEKKEKKKEKAMHKAMGMPSGEPCMTHGPEDGGHLDGAGKTSGASDAGMATAESTASEAKSKGKNYEGQDHSYPVAAADIQFDDEDVDLMKLAGGQSLSTLSKSTPAQMLDWSNPLERSHQVRSMAKSMMDNVDDDIENPQFDAPEPEAVEEEEEPTVIAKGMVRYTDAEDRRIEKAMKRFDSGAGHFAQTAERPFLGIRQRRDDDITID